jgi:Flp pilus assembly protein TadG
MRRLLTRWLHDDRASAATEMALALPMLTALMFGSIELGTYFWAEHKIIKAVRDGARFAARQPFADYAGCVPSTTVIDSTRNVTRTGQVADGGTPRLGYWTDPTTITVTAECDTTGTYTGVYATSTEGAPVVTVAASVPFTSFFGLLGIGDTTLTLNAHSESAVMGI